MLFISEQWSAKVPTILQGLTGTHASYLAVADLITGVGKTELLRIFALLLNSSKLLKVHTRTFLLEWLATQEALLGDRPHLQLSASVTLYSVLVPLLTTAEAKIPAQVKYSSRPFKDLTLLQDPAPEKAFSEDMLVLAVRDLLLRVVMSYGWLDLPQMLLHKCSQAVFTKADLVSLITKLDDARPHLYHPFLVHEGLHPKDVRVLNWSPHTRNYNSGRECCNLLSALRKAVLT